MTDDERRDAERLADTIYLEQTIFSGPPCRGAFVAGYAAACEAKQHWAKIFDKWHELLGHPELPGDRLLELLQAERTLKYERAHMAKLLQAAKRVLKFGFSQTEVNGVFKYPSRELADLIAEHETNR